MDRPGSGAQDPLNTAKERRLASRVRSHDGEDLVGTHSHGEVVEDDGLAVGEAQLLDVDDRRTGLFHALLGKRCEVGRGDREPVELPVELRDLGRHVEPDLIGIEFVGQPHRTQK